ncbi:MAG: SusC/RagA family TonB-linked outer membrane protein [Bacteroides sp.]|nr:SusC/RagA family TonB-linked outer membrane protein [Bacteroides sp.]
MKNMINFQILCLGLSTTSAAWKLLACCFLLFSVSVKGQTKENGSRPRLTDQDIMMQEMNQDGEQPDLLKWTFQNEVRRIHFPVQVLDTIDVDQLKKTSFISLQQWLKGQMAGVYVQEPNGEPGSLQSMLIRGTSVPLFSKNDINGAQPAVYINGVPVAQDRNYSAVIQSSDVNPLGTATNLFAGLHLNNIVSMEVIKDPVKLALLGPTAANGAIWIVTKEGFYGGKHVTLDAGLSFVTPMNRVDMTNAASERAFRADFYPTVSADDLDNYLPQWLTDRNDEYFFGQPTWANNYYQSAAQYNVNLSIGSGGRTANYLFTVGTSTNAGVADDTGYNKYNLGFYLNLLPFRGMTVSTMIQATKATRNRNSNMRDRYAEIAYMSELVTPIGPTEKAYSNYLKLLESVDDENNNAAINGALQLDYVWHNLRANVGVKFDYQTNVRHVFYPSTLMESVSYASDYSGYNRRFIGEAGLGYDFQLGSPYHRLAADWRGTIQQDRYHYNYSRGYDGSDDNKPTTSGGDYEMLRYLDQETIHLMSSAFSLNYQYKNLLKANVIFRQDGTSAVQSDSRWLLTPAVGIELNLKSLLLKDSKHLSALNLALSWARIGRELASDRYMQGAQYTTENIGFGSTSPLLSSYSGWATLSRPYTYGWIGYGIGWPYADKLEMRLDGAAWGGRLAWNLAAYINTDNDLMVPMAIMHETGYDYQWLQGMKIENRGLELTLQAMPVMQSAGWKWNIALNLAYNQNRLKALPGGAQETEIEGRLLKVGKSVDQFYVLLNKGRYETADEIPVIDGKPLSVNGTSLQALDPIWVDADGDNRITDADKVMKGNSLPRWTGGFSTTLSYKRWDLALHLFFAWGHEAMNHRAYQRYNFAVLEGTASLDAVHEIHFWQNGNLPLDYPRYNVLSEVNPYREDQDLYMESLSYAKLRTVTLGYRMPIGKGKKQKQLYLYLTGNNLLTISGFSGDDPELVDVDGYYRGYGLRMPYSFTLGARYSF